VREGRGLRSWCSTVVLLVVVVIVVLAKLDSSRDAVRERPHAGVRGSLETRNTGVLTKLVQESRKKWMR
jgi:hypothetical protein